MYKTLDEAIKGGKRLYKENPVMYPGEDRAIAIEISAYLWDQLNQCNDRTMDVVVMMQKITE